MSQFQSTLWTLISQARQGEERAVTDFGNRYQPAVVAYCRRLGLNTEEAEDAAQEVLLRFFCRGILQRVHRRHGRFRSLLCAVARNVVHRHWERQSAQKRAHVTRSLSELDVPEKVPDKTFDHEWIRHLIDLALLRLGRAHQQYHQVLSRFLLEDSSYAEIGRALGITETTVKNRVYRGKQKLIQLLRDEVRDYSLSWDQYAQELEYLAAALGSGRQDLQEAATVALGS